ncbi:hypothetical protein HKX48_009467 [Thoreauomyces humboldtii]|nr:hypothetical protein HKX48_009467 [Thoreauomyces humboldtii]
MMIYEDRGTDWSTCGKTEEGTLLAPARDPSTAAPASPAWRRPNNVNEQESAIAPQSSANKGPHDHQPRGLPFEAPRGHRHLPAAYPESDQYHAPRRSDTSNLVANDLALPPACSFDPPRATSGPSARHLGNRYIATSSSGSAFALPTTEQSQSQRRKSPSTNDLGPASNTSSPLHSVNLNFAASSSSTGAPGYTDGPSNATMAGKGPAFAESSSDFQRGDWGLLGAGENFPRAQQNDRQMHRDSHRSTHGTHTYRPESSHGPHEIKQEYPDSDGHGLNHFYRKPPVKVEAPYGGTSAAPLPSVGALTIYKPSSMLPSEGRYHSGGGTYPPYYPPMMNNHYAVSATSAPMHGPAGSPYGEGYASHYSEGHYQAQHREHHQLQQPYHSQQHHPSHTQPSDYATFREPPPPQSGNRRLDHYRDISHLPRVNTNVSHTSGRDSSSTSCSCPHPHATPNSHHHSASTPGTLSSVSRGPESSQSQSSSSYDHHHGGHHPTQHYLPPPQQQQPQHRANGSEMEISTTPPIKFRPGLDPERDGSTRERRFACTDCPKRFLRRQDLSRHAATHLNGFKPFRCPHCGTGFTRQDALHRHGKAKRCATQRNLSLELHMQNGAPGGPGGGGPPTLSPLTSSDGRGLSSPLPPPHGLDMRAQQQQQQQHGGGHERHYRDSHNPGLMDPHPSHGPYQQQGPRGMMHVPRVDPHGREQ